MIANHVKLIWQSSCNNTNKVREIKENLKTPVEIIQNRIDKVMLTLRKKDTLTAVLILFEPGKSTI